MAIVTKSEWDQFLAIHHQAHLLQSAAWGEFKTVSGWQAIYVIQDQNGHKIGAQILLRSILLGVKIAYLPKGPVFEHTGTNNYPPPWDSFWEEIDTVCHKHGAIFLKVEPDIWVTAESLRESNEANEVSTCTLIPAAANPPSGFIQSSHSVQPLRTIVVSLQGDDDTILGRMKQKTRYNIRLASKRGVVVQPSNDLGLFHRLMEITGERDHFGVHDHRYFSHVYEKFHSLGLCEMLVASYQSEPLAALMVFAAGTRAWYLYGASSNTHRDLMPTYILQWEAMRWARSLGCQEYDLWGTPDENLDTLEANFSQKADGLWGVYRFKRGFGGELRRSAGSWDRIYKRIWYKIYLWRSQRASL